MLSLFLKKKRKMKSFGPARKTSNLFKRGILGVGVQSLENSSKTTFCGHREVVFLKSGCEESYYL